MTGKLPVDKRVSGLLLSALIAGAIGGTLVVGLVMMILATTGGIKSSVTTRVTVREVGMPTTTSRSEYGLAASEIYERDAPGVVFVNASGVTAPQSAEEYLTGEGGERATTTGSGFQMDDSGTILTNWHAVEGASNISVGLKNGHRVTAQLVYSTAEGGRHASSSPARSTTTSRPGTTPADATAP
jgi:S1-C subfamily serine protease